MGRGGGEAATVQVRGGSRVTWPRSAYLGSGDPQYVDRLLSLCARCTLDAAEQEELLATGAFLDANAWREVAARARDDGLEALVLAHTSAAGLLERMPPDVVCALLDAYRMSWIGNRRLRGVLAEVLAAFARRGVSVMPFKGVALAMRYYGEPGLRPAGDLDLLVRRSDIAACRVALESLGCRPVDEMGRPRGFYPLLFRALVFLHPSGVTIELHWELVALPTYLPRLRANHLLWQRAEHIQILGQPARYLAPADELRYLAVHAIVQHADLRRMIWLVDIAELVRHLPSNWDWNAFADETKRLGLAGPVMAALLSVRQLGVARIPRSVLDTLIQASASPREQRAWGRSFGRDAGVQVPGAVLRHLRAQDSTLDRALLFVYLVGRARRRWLRKLVRRSPRQPREESVLLDMRVEPAPQAQSPESMSASSPRDAQRIEDRDTLPLPALLLSTGPLPAIAGPAHLLDQPTAPLRRSSVMASLAAAGADVVVRTPSTSYRIAKRVLDVVVAVVLLALMLPLLAVIALLIKLDGGPVIYRRQLLGYRGQPFYELKFRTMRPDAELLLAMDLELAALLSHNYKLREDPRVTPTGRWLRQWSIDELPQLWNVIRGDMSLVGPRPIHTKEAARFGRFVWLRQTVPPGITGLWQVSGRSDVTYEERIALDRAYVATCSFWRDVVILLRTIPAVVRNKGAY